MPVWMWLNIPLMVLVFAAVVGIPYWLVLRHPDQDAPASRRFARAAYKVPAQGRREESGERGEHEQRFPAVNGQRYHITTR